MKRIFNECLQIVACTKCQAPATNFPVFTPQLAQINEWLNKDFLKREGAGEMTHRRQRSSAYMA